MFRAAARRCAPRCGVIAGFAFYWLAWGVLFPTLTLGGRGTAACFRRARALRAPTKVKETDDVCSLYLGAEDGELPPFVPGQYLTFRVPIPSPEAPSVRTYSISDRHRPNCSR